MGSEMHRDRNIELVDFEEGSSKNAEQIKENEAIASCSS